jgi:hypothetical protein
LQSGRSARHPLAETNDEARRLRPSKGKGERSGSSSG